MQQLTLIVAVAAATMVVASRPLTGLIVYLATLLFYPVFLTIPIGTADINPGRVVVALLLVKCLMNPKLKAAFKWWRLDTFVTIAVAVHVAVELLMQPSMSTVINRAGYSLDTWFTYIAVRLCVTGHSECVRVCKALAIFLVPLALLGLVETFTGWQPYLPLTQFCPWKPEVRLTEARSGLYRAVGPFAHPIMFGICFATFLPLVYWLRHERNYWGKLAYATSLAAVVGALSSESSGPWMMVIVAILWLAIEKRGHLVKPLIISFVVGCILVGIISNRPFYHVIASYANPIGGSSWHRCKLIDCAIEDFGQWCLVGYGGQDPGWGPALGMEHTDITNEFILAGVKYGILGVAALVLVLSAGFRGLIRLRKSTTDAALKSFGWALGSSLVALVFVFMSVSIFGQMSSLFYCLLGMVGSASLLGTAKSLCVSPEHRLAAARIRSAALSASAQQCS